MKNIHSNDIWLNDEEEKEQYCSCHDLENGILFFADGVKHCCGLNDLGEEQIMIPYEENLEKTLAKVIEEKKRIIQDNRCGKKTMCTSCNRLVNDNWFKEKKIRQVNFSLDYICNLQCQYCDKWSSDYTNIKQKDISEMMYEMSNCKLVDITYPILYSSGEISILPQRDKILNSFVDYNVCFFSNATKYQVDILDKLKQSESCMVVSLDCGTRDTYKRIKGVDFFSVVCENIKMYSKNSGKVILKYIVTADNLAEKDLWGFLDICQESCVDKIIVAYKIPKLSDISRRDKGRFCHTIHVKNTNSFGNFVVGLISLHWFCVFGMR